MLSDSDGFPSSELSYKRSRGDKLYLAFGGKCYHAWGSHHCLFLAEPVRAGVVGRSDGISIILLPHRATMTMASAPAAVPLLGQFFVIFHGSAP
jgi:hypothetical protein